MIAIFLKKEYVWKSGVIWKCSNCKIKTSSFKSTVFENSNLPISTVFKIIYCFSLRMKNDDAMIECEISNKTYCIWVNMLRKICAPEILRKNKFKIGGPGKIVEIDESHLFNRKNNSGRVLKSNSTWLVGGICRETKEILCLLLPKETKLH